MDIKIDSLPNTATARRAKIADIAYGMRQSDMNIDQATFAREFEQLGVEATRPGQSLFVFGDIYALLQDKIDAVNANKTLSLKDKQTRISHYEDMLVAYEAYAKVKSAQDGGKDTTVDLDYKDLLDDGKTDAINEQARVSRQKVTAALSPLELAIIDKSSSGAYTTTDEVAKFRAAQINAYLKKKNLTNASLDAQKLAIASADEGFGFDKNQINDIFDRAVEIQTERAKNQASQPQKNDQMAAADGQQQQGGGGGSQGGQGGQGGDASQGAEPDIDTIKDHVALLKVAKDGKVIEQRTSFENNSDFAAVVSAQRILNDLNEPGQTKKYDLGTFGKNKDGIDGRDGGATAGAIGQFQEDHGLTKTGKLDATTITVLEAYEFKHHADLMAKETDATKKAELAKELTTEYANLNSLKDKLPEGATKDIVAAVKVLDGKLTGISGIDALAAVVTRTKQKDTDLFKA